MEGRGARSHIFRLRIRSCSNILNSDPGPKNLQIWESDTCSIQPKSSNVFTYEMPFVKNTQTPAAQKIKTDYESRPNFSHNFDSGSRSERKTQDPAGVDSGTQDP